MKHNRQRAFVALLLISVAFGATHKKTEYKDGTLISWGAGEHCSSVTVFGSANSHCDPSISTIIYRISADGHEYTVTKNAEHRGILDSKADPLRRLLPNAQFKYRLDEKGNFWVVWHKNNKPKEAKYSVRSTK